MENKAGGKRTNYRCRSRQRGEPRHHECEYQPSDAEGAACFDAADEPEYRRYQRTAEDDGADNESDGYATCCGNSAQRQRRAANQAAHYRKNYKPNHVVDHCRAEHDLTFARFELTQVGQRSGGNSDGCRSQCRACDDGGNRRQSQSDAHRVAQSEWQHDPDKRDCQRRIADLHQRADVGMKADLEQEYEHPQLGKAEQNRVGGIENAEHRTAEDDAGEKLADHCGLTQSLCEHAEQLGGQQQRDEDGEQVGKRMLDHVRRSEVNITPREKRIGIIYWDK